VNLKRSKGNIGRRENLEGRKEVGEVAKEKDQGLKEELRGQKEVGAEIIVIDERKTEEEEIDAIEIEKGVELETEGQSDLVGIENVEAERKEVAETVLAIVIVEHIEKLSLKRILQIVKEDVTHIIDSKRLGRHPRKIGIEGEDKDLILERKRTDTGHRIVKKEIGQSQKSLRIRKVSPNLNQNQNQSQ
jgi:hypothetical protein